MASKLYGVNATIIIFVFVLYCILVYGGVELRGDSLLCAESAMMVT